MGRVKGGKCDDTACAPQLCARPAVALRAGYTQPRLHAGHEGLCPSRADQRVRPFGGRGLCVRGAGAALAPVCGHARAGARSAPARLFPLRLARLRRRRAPPARPFPRRTGAEKTRGRSMRSPPSRKTPSTAICSRSRRFRRAAARAGWSAWRTRRARSARYFAPPTCALWRPWPKRGLRRTAPPLSMGDRTHRSAPVPACPRKGR